MKEKQGGMPMGAILICRTGDMVTSQPVSKTGTVIEVAPQPSTIDIVDDIGSIRWIAEQTQAWNSRVERLIQFENI